MIHYEVIYEVGGHASERLLMLADVCTNGSCMWFIRGWTEAGPAPSRVCSEPTGEWGSRFEYKMSPAASRTKSSEGKQALSLVRRGIGDLIKLFQALSETLWVQIVRDMKVIKAEKEQQLLFVSSFLSSSTKRLWSRTSSDWGPTLAGSLDAPPQHASPRAARWLRYYQRQRTEKQRLNIFSGTFMTRPLASLLTNVTPEDVCIRFYT